MEQGFHKEPIPKSDVEPGEWAEHRRSDLRDMWKQIFQTHLEHGHTPEELRALIDQQETDAEAIEALTVPRHLLHRHISAVKGMEKILGAGNVPLADIQREALDELQMERSTDQREEAA